MLELKEIFAQLQLYNIQKMKTCSDRMDYQKLSTLIRRTKNDWSFIGWNKSNPNLFMKLAAFIPFPMDQP